MPDPEDSRTRRWSFAVLLLATAFCSGCGEQGAVDIQTGTLIAAVPAEQAGQNSGAGSVGGLVLGAAAGGVLGRGVGHVVAAIAGAAIGGVAGSVAETATQSKQGAAYTVRLTDGQIVTILQHMTPGEPMLSPGQTVIIRNQGARQWVSLPSVGGE